MKKKISGFIFTFMLCGCLFGTVPRAAEPPAAEEAAEVPAEAAEEGEETAEVPAEAAAEEAAEEAAAAVPKDSRETDYIDIFLFEETKTLDLPRNHASYWFTIPEGTVISDSSYLSLDIKVSETLIDERSSIKVSVNETTLETMHIRTVEEQYQGRWKIQVPAQTLKPGALNELKIITAQRSIEGDCADIDNPANWVSLNKTSFLHIGIIKRSAPYLGNVYSYFYDNMGNHNDLMTEYVIPALNDTAGLEGIFKTAAAVGSRYRYKEQIEYRISEEKPAASPLENVIQIGLPDQWKEEPLSIKEKLYPGEGYLEVYGKGVKNPAYHLLITGGDEEGLSKAVDFFSAYEYLSQIDQSSLTVRSKVAEKGSALAVKESGYYTLEDYGYEDVNMAGAFHQSTSFSLPQPGGVRSGDSSYFLVKFRHSKALVADQSLLTVYINGTAVNSAKLSASNAEDGELKVKIPVEALNKESLDITIDCYNYLGKVDCSKDYYDSAWTVISKDSVLYLEPGDRGVRPTLTGYPTFPTFLQNGSRSGEVAVSLGDGYNQQAVEAAAVLAARAGQNSGMSHDFQVITAELTEAVKKKNMIFIGSYDSLVLPQEVGRELAILPRGGGKFEISEELNASAETLFGKTLFQVIRSPWDFSKRIYVLSYEKGTEEQVLEFIKGKENLRKLEGHVAVADRYGNVTNYSLGGEAEEAEKIPLTYERFKYLAEKQTGMPLPVIGGIVILVLVAVFTIVRVVKNKSRFKKAAEKMKGLNNKEEPIPEPAKKASREPGYKPVLEHKYDGWELAEDSEEPFEDDYDYDSDEDDDFDRFDLD